MREHERLLALVVEALPEGLPEASASNGGWAYAGGWSRPEITGFEILREVHRGGQGIVYEALQKSTRRRVAVKVMRDGPFAGPRDHARFEREICILAQLNHPNIVAIHDSGVTGNCFYSIMDFVPGRRLDEYLDAAGGTLRDNLLLFQQIAEAVNAAHQLGVIHRDLKPGNILVNDDGRPFILDFGLAKMTQITGGMPVQQITGETPVPHTMTQTGQFLGSLPWASPEQAEGSSQLDVRSDVYALGVMLYQGLTGRFPYDVSGALTGVVARIRHQQPPRPSTIAAELNDEIDTLVLRCLAKERERRYQSAGELARDLSRYLNGEPIEAKRDSGLYVLRKTLLRHKAVAMLSGLLMVSLAAFGVAMTLQSVRLARSRDDAVEARLTAEAQRDQARRERQRADAESEHSARLAYVSQIGLARRNLDLSAIAEMNRVLKATDSARRGWEWYRLQWLGDRSTKKLRVQSITTRAVVTSDDHILWGSSDGRIYRWDPFEPKMVFKRSIDDAPICTLALSSDERILHAASDCARFAMDARTGEVLDTHAQQDIALLYPWNDELVQVSGWPFADLSLIDLRTGTSRFNISYHRATPDMDASWLAVSPSEKAFAMAVGTAARIITRTGRHARSYPEPARGVTAVAYSPDGSELALSVGTGAIRIWDTALHVPVKTMSGHRHQVTALQFSCDGARLVSGDRDGIIRLWDAASGDCLSVLHGHTDKIISATFMNDERTIVSASEDETIRIWESSGRDHSIVMDAGSGYAAFSPDHTRVAVTDGAQLAVCNVDGSDIRRIEGAAGGTACGFFPDGRRAWLADQRDALHVWHVDTGEKLATLRHDAGVSAAACSADGRYLVTASWDTTCRVWDGSALDLQHTLAHSGEVWDAAISHDSRMLVSGTLDGGAFLWDLAAARLLRTWTGHGHEVDALAFSPDDQRVAVGCWGGLVRIYDVASGAQLAEWTSPHENIYSAAFTPDGRRLLLGTYGYVDVLDAHAGELIFSFHAHAGSIYALQLSPEAALLLTSSSDSSYKIWPALPMPATQPAPPG